MKIICKWNHNTGETAVKFTDISEDVAGCDFLRDCLHDVETEYNRVCDVVFNIGERVIE